MATDGPYRRVLLKLSGEALMGAQDYGLESETLRTLADDIAAISSAVSEAPLTASSAPVPISWGCWPRS